MVMRCLSDGIRGEWDQFCGVREHVSKGKGVGVMACHSTASMVRSADVAWSGVPKCEDLVAKTMSHYEEGHGVAPGGELFVPWRTRPLP